MIISLEVSNWSGWACSFIIKLQIGQQTVLFSEIEHFNVVARRKKLLKSVIFVSLL